MSSSSTSFSLRMAWTCTVAGVVCLLGLLLTPLARVTEAIAVADSKVDADSDWYPMPNGMYHHISCIYHFDSHFTVEQGDAGEHIIMAPGKKEQMKAKTSTKPCKYAPRASPPSTSMSTSEQLGYYSDWSVYAQSTPPVRSNFSFMSSTWTVPSKPKTRGPLGLSSVYFFNGLEDGGGHHGSASLILQPVLQIGKSGCVLNPVNWGDWHFVSYFVSGDGRAYCGKILKVETGQSMVGNMSLSGENSWTITSQVKETGSISSYTSNLNVQIDAAYLTCEGMIIYNCDTYPGKQVVFTNNILKTRDGSVVDTPKWTKEIRHTECGQNVEVRSDNSVALTWNP